MPWSSRRATLVLAAVTALGSIALPQHAYAQRVELRLPGGGLGGVLPALPEDDPTSIKDGFDNAGLNPPRDNSDPPLRDKVKAAEEYIKDAQWATATRALQDLIDRREDVFVPITREGPGGKKVDTWVSIKSEANRLLGTLPREGLDFYQLTYGPAAARMLKEARAAGDRALMAQVMNRFLYTEAGAEATAWLGTTLLDRGDYVSAGRYFERLLGRKDAKVSPKALFKAAYAFHMAGDRPNEEQTWKLLAEQARELQLANQARSVADLRDYVNQVARAEAHQSASDCRYPGGNPSRNAQFAGGTPYLEPRWKNSTVRQEDKDGPTLTWVRQAERYLEGLKQPVLTSFFPVTVTASTRDEQKVPLVIHRSYWGIHARDARTGKLVWETPSAWSVDRMLGKGADARKVQALNQWLPPPPRGRPRPPAHPKGAPPGTAAAPGPGGPRPPASRSSVSSS